jgi:CRISPR-associated protein Cas1
MLLGRLGLETARIPYKDRHGLLWLSRGRLVVEDGTLHFHAASGPEFAAGDYTIPFQMLSLVLLGPGTTVSHDSLRLLARHGTGLVAVGENGVKMYSAPPLGKDISALARCQVKMWHNPNLKLEIARRMYVWRFGEIPAAGEIAVLRGIEGMRIKEVYKLQASKHGISWRGRRYDRANPDSADLPNQAINHAATAVEAAAMIAVAATGTIPQLGFIHEDTYISFPLDIADLFRSEVVIPEAFQAVSQYDEKGNMTIEQAVRYRVGKVLREKKVIPRMIDRIKELFDADDSNSNS